MFDETPLAVIARNMLEQECKRHRSARGQAETPIDIRDAHQQFDDQLLHFVLAELVELVSQAHRQPVYDMRPTIRLRLLECSFYDETGDHCDDCIAEDRLNEMSQLLTNLLERVRQIAITDGHWSDAPVTPLMFG